jgi:hypothetical protein
VARLRLLATVLLLPLWMAAGGRAPAPAGTPVATLAEAGGLSPQAPMLPVAAEGGLILLDGLRSPGPSPRGGLTLLDTAIGRGADRSRSRVIGLLRLGYAQPLADARRNLPHTYGNPPPRSHS